MQKIIMHIPHNSRFKKLSLNGEVALRLLFGI